MSVTKAFIDFFAIGTNEYLWDLKKITLETMQKSFEDYDKAELASLAAIAHSSVYKGVPKLFWNDLKSMIIFLILSILLLSSLPLELARNYWDDNSVLLTFRLVATFVGLPLFLYFLYCVLVWVATFFRLSRFNADRVQLEKEFVRVLSAEPRVADAQQSVSVKVRSEGIFR
ncbi:MAG: hypothetical protein MRY72_03690 [Aquisalinus sp.]|nr:hypothetical protein [Aquisalinus sp.]